MPEVRPAVSSAVSGGESDVLPVPVVRASVETKQTTQPRTGTHIKPREV
ncbi:MAG: hypothetical protein H0Z40_01365 [Desulfotomaculum sp.]|nr:hypothetical protein [Desulfotomaculum sp.]